MTDRPTHEKEFADAADVLPERVAAAAAAAPYVETMPYRLWGHHMTPTQLDMLNAPFNGLK